MYYTTNADQPYDEALPISFVRRNGRWVAEVDNVFVLLFPTDQCADEGDVVHNISISGDALARDNFGLCTTDGISGAVFEQVQPGPYVLSYANWRISGNVTE